MIIRLADMDRDALAIHDATKDFLTRIVPHQVMPDSDEEIMTCVGRIIDLNGVEVVVAENDSGLQGCMGMLYQPFIWNPKMMAASEVFIWTAHNSPSTTFLRMLRFVERRMEELNVRVKDFQSLTSSPKGLDKVYRKMGLMPTQTTWMGVV